MAGRCGFCEDADRDHVCINCCEETTIEFNEKIKALTERVRLLEKHERERGVQ